MTTFFFGFSGAIFSWFFCWEITSRNRKKLKIFNWTSDRWGSKSSIRLSVGFTTPFWILFCGNIHRVFTLLYGLSTVDSLLWTLFCGLSSMKTFTGYLLFHGLFYEFTLEWIIALGKLWTLLYTLAGTLVFGANWSAYLIRRSAANFIHLLVLIEVINLT